MRHQASGIRHQATGIRHQATGARHQASGARHEAAGFPSLDGIGAGYSGSAELYSVKLRENSVQLRGYKGFLT